MEKQAGGGGLIVFIMAIVNIAIGASVSSNSHIWAIFSQLMIE